MASNKIERKNIIRRFVIIIIIIIVIVVIITTIIMKEEKNYKIIEKTWDEVQVGDIMSDGSVVTQVHETHPCECFKITISKNKLDNLFCIQDYLRQNRSSIVVSEDHLLLVDISKLNKKDREEIYGNYISSTISIEEEIYLFTDQQLSDSVKEDIYKALTAGSNKDIDRIKKENNIDTILEASEIIKSEPKIYNRDMNLIWLNALEINVLIKNGYNISTAGNRIIGCEYVGEKKCRCISTNTGRYTTDKTSDNHNKFNLTGYDFIHHNSVTIRNIIFHCVTHGIKIGLVDLKLTEFTPWKGHENVLGVANSVREAAELLRISRSLMYKRNAELAKAGVVDLADYKPKHPTSKVSVFGREYEEYEKCTIKDSETGEEKEITMKELLELLSGK